MARGQLGDMPRRQLVEARHPEQPHGACDLVGQDRDRAVDTGLAPAITP
jgi:hypothetical protein